MKTKIMLFAMLAAFALTISAQSDSYQNYLDKAMSGLENGDCAAAQKWYNVYKDLSGNTISSVEILIQDCNSKSLKKYAINDKIEIDGHLYRVAFVEDDGCHGFAIYDLGAGATGSSLTSKLPTRAEMSLIALNADKLKLQKDIFYWTKDEWDDNGYYYIYKLSNGKIKHAWRNDSQGRILIYRF